MPPQYITLRSNSTDITGQIFGRLTALGPVRRTHSGKIVWMCRCECGDLVEAQVDNLRSGHTRSCGCVRVQSLSRLTKTHGMSKHPFYFTWRNIVNRCTNPRNDSYAYYGGRGIQVCDEWHDSFNVFLGYISSLPDFGVRNYTIDRIDNSLGYYPGNLRWVSRKIQQRNRRGNHLLSHDGKTQSIAEWADEYNLKWITLNSRLRKGWSVERALITPVKKG